MSLSLPWGGAAKTAIAASHHRSLLPTTRPTPDSVEVVRRKTFPSGEEGEETGGGGVTEGDIEEFMRRFEGVDGDLTL